MPPPTPSLPAVPVRSVFATAQNDPSGSTSGVNWTWLKWFQEFQQAVSAQIAAIVGLTITSATQATLPTSLNTKDAGLIYLVSDYNHLLQWNGTNWTWAPGEDGSGYILPFLAAPTGVGWHLCDGSHVNRLNADGTISAVTLPDYTISAYLKFGTSAVAGPNAASGTTQPISAGTPSGTVSQPTFTGASDTTSIESGDTANVAVTGATSVAAINHTHTVTPTGTVSQPTFAGNALAAHSHGPGTIDLENTVLLAYFRQ